MDAKPIPCPKEETDKDVVFMDQEQNEENNDCQPKRDAMTSTMHSENSDDFDLFVEEEDDKQEQEEDDKQEQQDDEQKDDKPIRPNRVLAGIIGSWKILGSTNLWDNTNNLIPVHTQETEQMPLRLTDTDTVMSWIPQGPEGPLPGLILRLPDEPNCEVVMDYLGREVMIDWLEKDGNQPRYQARRDRYWEFFITDSESLIVQTSGRGTKPQNVNSPIAVKLTYPN